MEVRSGVKIKFQRCANKFKSKITLTTKKRSFQVKPFSKGKYIKVWKFSDNESTCTEYPLVIGSTFSSSKQGDKKTKLLLDEYLNCYCLPQQTKTPEKLQDSSLFLRYVQ